MRPAQKIVEVERMDGRTSQGMTTGKNTARFGGCGHAPPQTWMPSARQHLLRVAGALLMSALTALTSAPVAADYQKGAQFYGKQDYQNAYGALLPAADAGQAPAQFMIAVMYDMGYYVEKDGQAAAQWYRKAAEQGHPDAQLRLAGMLYEGVAVALDRAMAYQWAALAAERLHSPRQEGAVAFVKTVTTLLSDAQLERAKAAVAA